MKIFYNSSTKQWWHGQNGLTVTFGADQIEIPYQHPLFLQDVQSFDVKPFHRNEILTIGILTTSGKNKIGLGGNLPLFQSLHSYLLQHGILCYVFTANDILQEQPYGFIYCSELNTWKKITVPLPHIVYNRIPSRPFEASDSFQQLKTLFSNKHIKMFNPCFIDKYEMYTTFQQHERLKQLLPKTIVVGNINQLASFLRTYSTIYLKPRDGNRGKGIHTLTCKRDKSIQLASPTEAETFPTLQAYWDVYKQQLQSRKYLAQQAIVPKKKNGHRYDYRLLVHYEQGRFKLSGKGVRMSQTQEITTHVPTGGKIIPYHEVTTPALDQQLTEIAQTCGAVLSHQLGFIGEFSIDLGENEAGNLFIYEVNSKPMQFDETDIETTRLHQLKNLFIELKYPNDDKK
ncbi:YheC/YheD family protein [Peribacillus asahii]|uniref:YheC/YheD family endospore coat-associated protein n=1 Tax=Peribacillus asahii TaxID=228899 RepID=UPI00382FB888